MPPEERPADRRDDRRLLGQANKADSAAGALAVTKATNKEVKDFAKLMMSEHHALRRRASSSRRS